MGEACPSWSATHRTLLPEARAKLAQVWRVQWSLSGRTFFFWARLLRRLQTRSKLFTSMGFLVSPGKTHSDGQNVDIGIAINAGGHPKRDDTDISTSAIGYPALDEPDGNSVYAVWSPVPEPSTASLLALGLVGIAAARRRRAARAQ
jgi:hypothetical protein